MSLIAKSPTDWLVAPNLRDYDRDDADLGAIEARVAGQVDEAVRFAEAGPWEPLEDLTRDVYTPVQQ